MYSDEEQSHNIEPNDDPDYGDWCDNKLVDLGDSELVDGLVVRAIEARDHAPLQPYRDEILSRMSKWRLAR